MFRFGSRRVVWIARTLTRSASTPPSLRLPMAILWIILLVTIGLSVRAGLYRRRWDIAESDSHESADDSGLVDTCARTFILVLLSLIGLLVLGLMYGNVLGAVPAST